MIHVSFLYKPQEFMKDNYLDMFKYGEFINSIKEDEIDKMNKEEKVKYNYSLRYIKQEDKNFFNALSIVSNKYHNENIHKQ